MFSLTTARARQCEGFFPGIADTALLSALQGHMGSVMADNTDEIHFIMARCGDYFYFGGDPNHPEAEACIRSIPDEGYAMSFEQAWQERILAVLGARAQRQRRHIIKRDMKRLDRAHLRAMHSSLPEGFRMVRIDTQMAQELRDAHWSHEYVNQFESAEDFVQRGYGYAILHGLDIACIGVTFSIYDDGMEMGIATNPDYRKLGLATIAASRTVLETLNRGWVLNWDAANEISLRLAQKMGFEKCGEYDVIVVHEA